MKIYFNTTQFPDALKECSVNDDISVLENDIEYIPSNINKVVIENDEDDMEDWQTLCENWESFIEYLINTIQENMSEEDIELYESLTCMDIFENEFIIVGK